MNKGLKVVLITQGVSRPVPFLLQSRHQIVGVVESLPRTAPKSILKKMLIQSAKYLYYKVKGKEASLKLLCEHLNIPYARISKGRDALIAEWIAQLQPDVIVIYSMSQLIKKNIIDIPKLGVINLHPAYLPEYRGPNPDFWQYYDMEMNPGATVHYVDEGEDTGDIIVQDKVHIPLGTKSPDRLDKLIGELGSSLILKALDAIENGTAPRIKQPAQSPNPRARNLNTDEHSTIIDWENWSIEHIWHVLRGTELWLDALPPLTGIFYGQRWIIGAYIKTKTNKKPGRIYKIDGKYCVATKEGFILVKRTLNLKNLILSVLTK